VSGTRDLDLLVLGDVNPDLVLSDASLPVAFGQAETLVQDAELTIGGSGAIMACAAARLGLRTALAGLVGADQFGTFMRDALVAREVDVGGVVVERGVRTGLTVVLARPGDRAILTFAGAIAVMTADRVDRALVARARHVHVSSFYLQTALAPGLPALLRAARAGGATTSLDPNWDPSGGWDGGVHELLGELDVLLPNAVEARRIAGVDDVERAARALAQAGPTVVVKLGEEGALAVAPGAEPIRVTAMPGITPVDAVGAGDTFDAGLLAGLLGGEPLESAVSLACACGALSLRAAGGTAAQPTLDEARRARRGGAPADPVPRRGRPQ
jgi:sugar/nucleoside kinase (ribokinase family)